MIVDVSYKCKLKSTVKNLIIPTMRFEVHITYKALINRKHIKDYTSRTFTKNEIDYLIKDKDHMKAYFLEVIKTEIEKNHKQKIKNRCRKQAFKPFKKWTSCKIDVNID